MRLNQSDIERRRFLYQYRIDFNRHCENSQQFRVYIDQIKYYKCIQSNTTIYLLY
jgi:hypothetical protein